MQITTTLTCLSALAPVIRALRITQPDGSEPVNVSNPVEIAWEHDDDDSESRWLELRFASGYENNLLSFGADMMNDTRIDSRRVSNWTWYGAPKWFADWEEGGPDLYQGGCFIEGWIWDGQFMNSTGSREDATEINSEKFDLEGYSHMGSAGKLSASGLGFAVVSATCLMAAGL